MKFLLGLQVFFMFSFPVHAQDTSQRVQVLEVQSIATDEPQIATSAAESTPSGQISEKIQEKIEKDITTTTSTAKSVLAQYLDENPTGPLSPINLVQYGIRNAVEAGVPANILVLLLLFPVVTTLIVFFRHIIGLEGFGVYTPAVLSVAFVSTGIYLGLFLFLIVLIASWIGKLLVSKLKLQYLPRTSLLMWFVSIGMFLVLIISPRIPFSYVAALSSIGIFQMLVVILLSENFMAAQFSSNMVKAIELTVETIMLAVISTLVLRSVEVQKFVILNPEGTLLVVFVANLLVGKYTGLRFLEVFRFRQILDAEE